MVTAVRDEVAEASGEKGTGVEDGREVVGEVRQVGLSRAFGDEVKEGGRVGVEGDASVVDLV